MSYFSRRSFLVLGLAACLAGCGEDSEQRKALIDALQSGVLDKAGANVPDLTADEIKALGPYAEHLGVLVAFKQGFDGLQAKAIDQFHASAVYFKSIGTLVQHKDELTAASAMLAGLSQDLTGLINTADTKHAALKMPDDVGQVFDKAYERVVAAPGQALLNVIAQMSARTASSLDMIAFIEANQDAFQIAGDTPVTTDPALEPNVNGLIQKVNETNAKLGPLMQKFQAVVRG
jgi:phage tail sheath protein FI